MHIAIAIILMAEWIVLGYINGKICQDVVVVQFLNQERDSRMYDFLTPFHADMYACVCVCVCVCVCMCYMPYKICGMIFTLHDWLNNFCCYSVVIYGSCAVYIIDGHGYSNEMCS